MTPLTTARRGGCLLALLIGVVAGSAAGTASANAPAAGPVNATAAPAVTSSAASSTPSPADLQAYAKLPVCALSADGKRLAVEPCRTAPARVPMPRRPVPLIIQRMPTARLAPQVGMPAMPPSQSLQSLMSQPGAPIPVTSCDAGGCYDPSGVRHNNAANNTSITPAGKLCMRNGTWLQCP